jgi:hypothetical protein
MPEVIATFAFLCHRYSHDLDYLNHHPESLADLLRAYIKAVDPIDWLLDLRTWSAETAYRLFRQAVRRHPKA